MGENNKVVIVIKSFQTLPYCLANSLSKYSTANKHKSHLKHDCRNAIRMSIQKLKGLPASFSIPGFNFQSTASVSI